MRTQHSVIYRCLAWLVGVFGATILGWTPLALAQSAADLAPLPPVPEVRQAGPDEAQEAARRAVVDLPVLVEDAEDADPVAIVEDSEAEDSEAGTATQLRVEAGQDVLVDGLADTPERDGQPREPTPVVLMERSTGQRIILNPGQEVIVDLPQEKIQEAAGETLLYPLPIAVPVTSGFGMRVHPISGMASFHQGIDLGAPHGTPVLAAYSGQILASGMAGGLGNAVVIAHDDKQRTRYGHMSKLAVTANSWVNQGDIIGYVGSTGNSTGPHLHFEFWQRDRDWIALDVTDDLKLALAKI